MQLYVIYAQSMLYYPNNPSKAAFFAVFQSQLFYTLLVRIDINPWLIVTSSVERSCLVVL